MLPVAVDALGGDKAPAEIVEGAKQAVAAGIPVVLVGPADLADRGDLPLHVATEFIDMHEDPASSVRNKKDSTLVVSADLVRDGVASAMISAGNTGATMASALLRMGRIKGVSARQLPHQFQSLAAHQLSCWMPVQTPKWKPNG